MGMASTVPAAVIMPGGLPSQRGGARRFWRRWWKWGLALMLVAGGAAAAALVGRPLYHAWERREASAMVAQARHHLDAERWEEASKLLGEAYQKSPDQEDVLRALMELVRRTSPSAERQLFFLRQLSAGGHSTAEDQVRMAESHLALRQPDEARQLLDKMSPAEREGRYGLELRSLLARADGRQAEAQALLRRSWEKALEDPECRLRLATLDLRNPFKEVQQRAEDQVWSVARGKDRAALLAIELLSGQAGVAIPLTPAQADELWKLVRTHPFASPRRELAVLGAYVKARPERREEMIEEEATRLEGRPLEDRMDFLRWLATGGDHERFLKLVPRDKALLMRELFPLYVEALAASGRWQDLKEAMSRTSIMPLNAAEKALLQARLARGLGEPVETVKGYFREACRHAGAMRDYRGLLRAAAFSEEAGFADVALEAYRSAAASSKDPAVMERLLQLQQQRGQDAESILLTVEDLLKAQPKSREQHAARSYLKLLLGREMEVCAFEARRSEAEGLLTANAAAFVRAFAAYRELDPERVRSLVAKVDAEALPTGQRAVLAGLLADCGETARAFAIAEKISPVLLMKEEAAFLKKAL